VNALAQSQSLDMLDLPLTFSAGNPEQYSVVEPLPKIDPSVRPTWWERSLNFHLNSATCAPSADAPRAKGDRSGSVACFDPINPIASMDYRDVVAYRRAARPRPFEVLQRWEGEVQKVGPEEFEALLHDLTDTSQKDEIASLLVSDVSPDDLQLLVPGGVFYWSIGYSTDHGQVERTSRLRFRRLPAWSKKELQSLETKAAELAEAFGVSFGSDSSACTR
jgi:hypothetical protein